MSSNMINRNIRYIFLILINLKFYNCEELIASLSYQNNNGSDAPIKLAYNWQNETNDNQRTLKLNLTLLIESSSTTNFSLNQPASIKINCSTISSNASQFSDLFFNEFIDTNFTGSKEIQIHFEIKTRGQSPYVRCTGETISFNNQNVNDIQLTGLKFANSLDFWIQIRPFPGIAFVNTLENKTNIEISPFESSKFDVYFRDFLDSDTQLNCSLEPLSQYFYLVKNSSIVPAGKYKFQIDYKINLTNSSAIKDTFNLTCNAESIKNGQYKPSFAIANATIQFKQPSIRISSDLIKFTGKKFSLPLFLDPIDPSHDFTVECSLKRFSSFNSLENCTAAQPLSGNDEPDLSNFTYNKTNFNFCFVDPTNSSQCSSNTTFNLKDSAYLSIKIDQTPPADLSSNLKLYLCLFCQDTSTAAIKYVNYSGKILLNLAKNSDPNDKNPIAPTNDDLLNPAYDPCLCDLTPNICDLDCCCDKSCSPEDRAAAKLDCPIKVRPVFDKIVDRWYCTDVFGNPRAIEEDWFPIICINFNTTVLLGKFYSPITLNEYVKDQNEKFVNDVQNKIKQTYNYRSRFLNDPKTNDISPITKSTMCSLNKKSYEYGSCLLQAEAVDMEPNDFFRFPQAVNSFQSCLYSSPLRFLINTNRTFCPLTLNDPAECSDQNPKINLKFFINKFIVVNSNQDKQELNEIEFYQCSSPIFASQLPENNPSSVGSCNPPGFNSKTKIFDTEFKCEVQWTGPSTSNLNEISEDYYLKVNNNCQLIQNPDLVVELDADRCKNVLAGIKHLIFWQGNSIKKILTRVLLTDIDIDDKNFKQFFETKWIHLPSSSQDNFNLNTIATVSEYDDLITSLDYLKTMRSGHRGYVNGKPIISGFFSNSNIDISLAKRFSTFRSLNGKLCGQFNQQERILVSFGKNISSTCVVQVAKEDLIDEDKCKSIRKIMFQKLNDYFVASNRVSKNGRPNLELYNETEWLEVFRSKFNESINDGKDSDGINRCRNVPYKVNLYLFYGDVGRLNGEVINEILGAYVKVDYRDWVFICTSNNDCSNQAKDFKIEFEALFINDFKKNLTWVQQCQMDKYPSQICIQEALWTWPRDFNDPQFFYLYSVHLGLIFGILSILVFHFMLFGLVCPC